MTGVVGFQPYHPLTNRKRGKQTMATKNDTRKIAKSKTDQALDYMALHGCSAYEAAQAIGVSAGGVYRRMKNLRDTADKRCPHCHQIMK